MSMEFNNGNLSVIFHEANVTNGMFDNQIEAKEAPIQQTVVVGQKFWQQAGVGTVAGTQVTRNKKQFLVLQKWSNVTAQPTHTHTPSRWFLNGQ